MAATKDPKDIVLLALFAEFNKQSGDFQRITAQMLDMEPAVWVWSLMCLKTEGLVDGVTWILPNATSADRVRACKTKDLHLTREGVLWARELMATDGKNRQEVLRQLFEFFKGLGLPLMLDLIRTAM